MVVGYGSVHIELESSLFENLLKSGVLLVPIKGNCHCSVTVSLAPRGNVERLILSESAVEYAVQRWLDVALVSK